MQFLIPLAGLLGLEVEDIKERATRSAVYIGLLGLFGIVTLAFGLVALHAWLVIEVGPIYAPLVIAGVALLLALLTWLVMAIGAHNRTRRVREKKRSTDSTALMTTAALTVLPALFRSPIARRVGLPLGALAAVLLLNRSEQHPED